MTRAKKTSQLSAKERALLNRLDRLSEPFAANLTRPPWTWSLTN